MKLMRPKSNPLIAQYAAAQRQAGFTLIELLVVIAIIGILAAVVLGSLNSARVRGQVAAAQSQLQEIRKAMLLLHADTGFYPSGANNVTDLCTNPGNPNEIAANAANAGLVSNGRGWSGWNGPYIPANGLIDPWGTPYYFDSDYDCDDGGGEPVGCEGFGAGGQNDSVIVSCGPDQQLSTLSGALGCEYNADNVVLYLCSHP